MGFNSAFKGLMVVMMLGVPPPMFGVCMFNISYEEGVRRCRT